MMAAFLALSEPHRDKGRYGGRGGARSWTTSQQDAVGIGTLAVDDRMIPSPA